MKQKQKPLRPRVVLGVAAHPDDLDFCAAGTIAQCIQQGATVYYLILTNGNKGTSNQYADLKALIATRREEQQAAAALLGVREVFFLNYEDCALDTSPAVKKDIVRYIRKLQPDAVLAMDPSMLFAPKFDYINHPDHRAAGQDTLDAVFPLARDVLSFPELLDEGLQPHKVQTVLLTNLEQPNYFVDISDVFDKKLQALDTHKSQIEDAESMHLLLEDIAKQTGSLCGCQYAEGFVRVDVPG